MHHAGLSKRGGGGGGSGGLHSNRNRMVRGQMHPKQSQSQGAENVGNFKALICTFFLLLEMAVLFI